MQVDITVSADPDISDDLGDALAIVTGVQVLVAAAQSQGLTKEQLKDRIGGAIDVSWPNES